VQLLKIAVVLAVIGVILYDASAVMVNAVQTDELGQMALRAAVAQAQTVAGRQPEAITEAARTGLGGSDRARLDAAVLDETGLTVTISQDARVLILDRLGPLSDLATSTVTKTAQSS
jgi:hypothetical protein